MQPSELRVITKYLRQFNIDYIDLQAELIDHFASAVSHIQEKHPELNFQQGLMKAHQRFGGKAGFRKYRLAAENRIEKKILKTMGSLAMRLLAWPAVLKIFAAVVIAWFLNTYLSATGASFLVVISLLLGQAFFLHVKWRKSAYYLVKRSLSSLAMYLYIFIYLPYSNVILFIEASFNVQWFLASLFLLFFLIIQGLPAALQEIAQEEYPSHELEMG